MQHFLLLQIPATMIVILQQIAGSSSKSFPGFHTGTYEKGTYLITRSSFTGLGLISANRLRMTSLQIKDWQNLKEIRMIPNSMLFSTSKAGTC